MKSSSLRTLCLGLLVVAAGWTSLAATAADDMPPSMARYIVGLLRRGPEWTSEVTDATQEIQRGHMANIGRLVDSGELVLAGPFESDGDLRGLFFFNVETLEQARALTESDPAVKSGRLVVELIPWWGTARLKSMRADPSAETADHHPDGEQTAAGAVLKSAVIETACGQCQFDLDGDGCDLAVRIGEHAWFVDGTSIDEHGDAHAEDGFCNAVRQARVSGHVVDGRFQVTAFEMVPADGH
jgi:uncharacterized protein YciI